MNSLFKFLTPSALLALLPMFLVSVGQSIKDKDDNSTGSDDALGNVIIAFAPALSAFGSKDETKLKQALQAAYATLGNYLGKS